MFTIEDLHAMKIGDVKQKHYRASGRSLVHKLEKMTPDMYHLKSFTGGMLTATLTEEEALRYLNNEEVELHWV
jgi:hypothetical protein